MNKQPKSIRRALRRGRVRIVDIAGSFGGMMVQRKTNKGTWENLYRI